MHSAQAGAGFEHTSSGYCENTMARIHKGDDLVFNVRFLQLRLILTAATQPASHIVPIGEISATAWTLAASLAIQSAIRISQRQPP